MSDKNAGIPKPSIAFKYLREDCLFLTTRVVMKPLIAIRGTAIKKAKKPWTKAVVPPSLVLFATWDPPRSIGLSVANNA